MNTIFVDLDGVLVDWVGGVLRLTQRLVHPREVEWDLCKQLGMPRELFWGAQGREFWAGLTWTEEGPELWPRLFGRGAKLAMLSSPCRTPGCSQGKRDWVERHMPGWVNRLFLGSSKYLLAGPGKTLVDDNDGNIDAWVSAGGRGVLVPRPWNRRRDETDAEGRFDVASLVEEIIPEEPEKAECLCNPPLCGEVHDRSP